MSKASVDNPIGRNEEDPLLKTGENPIEEDNNESEDRDGILGSLYSLKSSNKQESTASIGAMTLIKYVIATGILALPYAASKIGILPSWILIFLVGYLNLYTMQLLDQVATQMGLVKVDLGRLCERATRRLWFRYFAEINLHIMSVGSVIAEIVFISEYLGEVSCDLNWTFFCNRKVIQFTLILILVIPVMTITDIHYLGIPNSIALVFQIMFCIVFIVAAISQVQEQGVASGGFRAAITKFEYTAIPVAFTTVLYAYEGIGVLLEIRSSVRADTNKLNKVLNCSLFFSAAIYIIFSSAAVFAYGNATDSIIFLNLNQNNKFFVVVEFGYIIAIILGIPTALFPITRIIENYKIFRKFIVDEKTKKKSKLKRQVIRLPLVALVVGVATVIPSFNSFLSFVSGVNFTVLSFVIPVILYYIRFKGDRDKRLKFFVNWIMLGLGVILGGIATVQSVIDMVNASKTTA